jgi:hypothetical protein
VPSSPVTWQLAYLISSRKCAYQGKVLSDLALTALYCYCRYGSFVGLLTSATLIWCATYMGR